MEEVKKESCGIMLHRLVGGESFCIVKQGRNCEGNKEF